MNFKTFAIFIIILGGLIFGYGGIQYLNNQPKQFNGGNLLEVLNIQTHNLISIGKRKSATKVMVAGGIVLFIGIAVFFSSQDKTRVNIIYKNFKTKERFDMKKSGSIVSIIASLIGIASILTEELWFKIDRSSGQSLDWWSPWAKFTFGFLPWFAIACLVASLIGLSISIKNNESLQKVSAFITILWLVFFVLLSFTDIFITSFWSEMLTAWKRWQ